MVDFEFVTDDALRESLERDYAEVQAALSVRAWKATIVLAGSITEAVLVDHLIANKYQERSAKDPRELNFQALITAAEAEMVLTSQTAHAAHAIRLYRNLVHPGRELRLAEVVDEDAARTAKTLLDRVLREVSKRSAELRGYTAKAFLRKLESDPMNNSVHNDLLRSMKKDELGRLLLLLPDQYFELVGTDKSRSGLLPALRACFFRAQRLADPWAREALGARHARILREANEAKIRMYEDNFFDAWLLNEYRAEDALLVVDHILDEPTSPARVLELEDVWNGLLTFLEIYAADNSVEGKDDRRVHIIYSLIPALEYALMMASTDAAHLLMNLIKSLGQSIDPGSAARVAIALRTAVEEPARNPVFMLIALQLADAIDADHGPPGTE